MAAAVAHATSRVSALIVGGYSPLDAPSEGWVRRTYRELTPNSGGHAAFWRSYKRFDWLEDPTGRDVVAQGSSTSAATTSRESVAHGDLADTIPPHAPASR